MTMVELIVDMDCVGCESKIKKSLKKLKGVDEVDVDMNMQKVTVMGSAETEKILKAVKKTGRKAELWPYTPEYQHNIAVQQYYHQYHYGECDHHHHDEYHHQFTVYDVPNLPSIISHHYLQTINGHDDFGYGYGDDSSTLVDDHEAISIFSDENPHACSIM